MKPLSSYQRVLSWICLDPAEESHSIHKVLFTCSVFFFNIFGLSTSLAFFWKYLSTSIDESLYATFQIAATISTFYVSLIAFFSKHKIKALFKSLSGIYGEYTNRDSFRFLVRANEKSQWIWQVYLKFILCGFPVCAAGLSLLSMAMGWIITNNVYSKYLYRPYKVILPWNQHTLIGYIGEICVDILFGEAYLLSNGLPLLLFVLICYHHRAFYEIFQHSLSKLDNLNTRQLHTQFLTDLVRSHISMKALFFESAEMFSLYVLVELICSEVILACSAFEFDLQSSHISFDISIVFVAIAVGSSNLFCWCFLGKLATESYENMADSLYDTNWHKLSTKAQKYVVLIIRNAQKPLYYEGFGVAVLNLVTFTKMLQTVITYFMMFKAITSD